MLQWDTMLCGRFGMGSKRLADRLITIYSEKNCTFSNMAFVVFFASSSRRSFGNDWVIHNNLYVWRCWCSWLQGHIVVGLCSTAFSRAANYHIVCMAVCVSVCVCFCVARESESSEPVGEISLGNQWAIDHEPAHRALPRAQVKYTIASNIIIEWEKWYFSTRSLAPLPPSSMSTGQHDYDNVINARTCWYCHLIRAPIKTKRNKINIVHAVRGKCATLKPMYT